MFISELIEKRIRKRGSQWCVVSEHGNKNLGCSDSKAGAAKRLGQVEYFKHANKSLTEEGIVASLEEGSLNVSDASLKSFYGYLEAKAAYTVTTGYHEMPLVTVTANDGNPVPSVARMIMYRDMIGTAGWSADGLRDAIVANGAKLNDVIGVWYHIDNGQFLVNFKTFEAEKLLADTFGQGTVVDYKGWPEGQPGVITIYPAKKSRVDKYVIDGVAYDDVPIGITKNFSSEGDAHLWLGSTFRLVPVISDSVLDVVGGRYAYCGVVWGTDTGGVIKAQLVDALKLPMADIESGRAKIYGAGGILRKSSVHKHLPGMHDQQAHAGGGPTALGGGDTARLAKYFLGSGAKQVDSNKYEWRKSGGYTRAKDKALFAKLKENGFERADSSTSSSQADEGSVGSGVTYRHPDGFEVTVDSYFGATAASNRHTYTFEKTSVAKHLPGKHDQRAHAGMSGPGGAIAHTPAQLGSASAVQYAKENGVSIAHANRVLSVNNDVANVIHDATVDVDTQHGFEQGVSRDELTTGLTIAIANAFGSSPVEGSLRSKVQAAVDRAANDDWSATGRGQVLRHQDSGFVTRLQSELRSIMDSQHEWKHLPGKHDQQAHGRIAAGSEIKVGMKAKKSSLEAQLRGKDFEGKIIRNIRNTGSDKKERLVIFKDGTGAFVPTAALLKMAFGHGGKGEAGKTFKTARALHQSGFVSWAQANYLLQSKPEVYWQLRADANSGKRTWDNKTKKFVTYEPEKGDVLV